MVGFKWEGTDAVNAGRLIPLSQNPVKTGKLLKQELVCVQISQPKDTMLLGIQSIV